MGLQYLGEVRAVSFAFAPYGWAQCNGKLLPIQQNQALFSLLGTQFGGDGISTFQLPDLRGRTPVANANGAPLGVPSGSESVTMTMAQLPLHTHLVQASTATATAADPTGQVWAPVVDGSGTANLAFTENAPDITMSPAALATMGGSQPISVMQPYNVINYIIALTGIYPSRD